MKLGYLTVAMVIIFGSTICRADIVERFEVGSPFDVGAGMFPATETSINNYFNTAPFETGIVEARNARSILAGAGDVAMTARADGTSALDFDMGVGLQLTTLPTSTLLYSEVRMLGIESDADAANFKFSFSSILLDGTIATDLADVSITTTSGTINFTNLDAGLFEAEVEGIVGSADILFTGANGKILRGLQFTSITPDFETDSFRVAGSRTLSGDPEPVPEPGTLGFLLGIGTVVGLRRRRISEAT